MSDNGGKIQLFEDKRIRTAWDEANEEWLFSIVDVVGVLTDQPTQRNTSTYWAVLKKRLVEEGADQLLTNCKQLKLKAADGKRYNTDVANTFWHIMISFAIIRKQLPALRIRNCREAATRKEKNTSLPAEGGERLKRYAFCM